MSGDAWGWRESHFDRLAGTDRLRLALSRASAGRALDGRDHRALASSARRIRGTPASSAHLPVDPAVPGPTNLVRVDHVHECSTKLRVTGPTLPSPTARPSISTTGRSRDLAGARKEDLVSCE